MKSAVNGAELRVYSSGQGPLLLLLHGGPGIGDSTAPIAELLDSRFRVIRFDQRGCGESSLTPPYDVPTLMADIEALRVQQGAEGWIVAGHSWGADVALAYTLAHPQRVTALLHLSGTGVQNDRSWKETYQRGLAEGREVQRDFGPVNADAKRDYLQSWRKWIRSPDLLRRLAECPVPALFVVGSEDIRPGWPNAQLAALMPSGRFEVVEGAGHLLCDTHGPELKATLLSFLKGSVQMPA